MTNCFPHIGLISLFFVLSACTLNKNSKDTNVGSTDTIESFEYTGSFKSVAGVMDKLSCYTSNGGYLKNEDGNSIMVSFDNNSKLPDCKKIKVVGTYTSKSINSDDTSPCPSGSLRFLKVTSFECL